MYQHNGYYGCQYCDHPGVSYGSTHCYYPLNLVVNNEVYRVKRNIREPSDHLHLVEKAENFLREGNKAVNMAGVKGKSPFSSLVKGLPLSALCFARRVFKLTFQTIEITEAERKRRIG